MTVSNTTSETALNPATGVGSRTIAANSLNVGDTIRVRVRGHYGTAATGPTFQWRLYMGSILLAQTAANSIGNNLTNKQWKFDGTFTVWSTGSSGTVMPQADVLLYTTSSTIAGRAGDANTAVKTVNTTADQDIELRIVLSAADPLNYLTITNLEIDKV